MILFSKEKNHAFQRGSQWRDIVKRKKRKERNVDNVLILQTLSER